MITALIHLVVVILVVALICWALIYCISLFPLPAPFGQILRAIVILLGVLIVIYALLPLAGVH
jgi:hypothetical protein